MLISYGVILLMRRIKFRSRVSTSIKAGSARGTHVHHGRAVSGALILGLVTGTVLAALKELAPGGGGLPRHLHWQRRFGQAAAKKAL
jgi:hypothetical protein